MKVLFIDSVHSILEKELSEKGFECVDGTKKSRTEILNELHYYDGIVIRSRTNVDEVFLDQTKDLKFIARSGSGLENIDLSIAESKGITVFNSPEGNRDAVGEQVIGMLLMLFNNLKRADSEVRNGVWLREENRGLEIFGKTVGIIGFGNTGSVLAKKLQGFDCKIIAYDKYKTDFSNEYIEEVSMEELFSKANIVSLHLPITKETHYFVDGDFISSMKRPFYLINAARGKNVNTADLVIGLNDGKVLGACLDVLEYEKNSFEKLQSDELPQDFQYLINSDKTILSPHIAGWTEESYVKLSTYLAEKIINKFG